MTEPMTAADFASKVEWEGGVMEALDYGLKPAHAPEGPIREAWTRLYQVWQQLSPIADEVSRLLNGVGRTDEDGEG